MIDPRYAELAPYTRSAGIYKCPADLSAVTIGNRRYSRIRSISMNTYLGDDGLGPIYRWWTGSPPFRRYLKRTDLVAPPPSLLWVFVDEHPDSINNGDMAVKCDAVGPAAEFVDYPAGYHNGACGFSLAGTHAEIKKWLGPRTESPVTYTGTINGEPASPNNPDIAWTALMAGSRRRIEPSLSGARSAVSPWPARIGKSTGIGRTNGMPIRPRFAPMSSICCSRKGELIHDD